MVQQRESVPLTPRGRHRLGGGAGAADAVKGADVPRHVDNRSKRMTADKYASSMLPANAHPVLEHGPRSGPLA